MRKSERFHARWLSYMTGMPTATILAGSILQHAMMRDAVGRFIALGKTDQRTRRRLRATVFHLTAMIRLSRTEEHDDDEG